ncbi:MAG: hypothetical protein GY922_12585 [Proteobacteria bacterium]|nr:hypothetical protein [Pseudomonadota bacterium]
MRSRAPQRIYSDKWPVQGYVLSIDRERPFWRYLESAFVRDGFQPLSAEQINGYGSCEDEPDGS